jgi:hypothetical protein
MCVTLLAISAWLRLLQWVAGWLAQGSQVGKGQRGSAASALVLDKRVVRQWSSLLVLLLFGSAQGGCIAAEEMLAAAAPLLLQGVLPALRVLCCHANHSNDDLHSAILFQLSHVQVRLAALFQQGLSPVLTNYVRALNRLFYLQVELSCRVATLLLRLHHAQLTATPSARQTLVDLHKRLRAAVQGLRDTLGFNIAALKYMQRVAKDNAGVDEGDVVKAARRQLLAG